MTRRAAPQADSDIPHLPALLLLFLGSGCAALIYQVVWLQLLELVIGSSAISLAVLLGTFMGGMGLGSLVFPRFVGTTIHPLKAYACLEAGIGVAGLMLLYGMPLVHEAYAVTGGGVLIRARRCRAVSPAPDDPDGRDAPGGGPMGRSDSVRRFVAGVLLRRQHRAAPSRAPCWRASTCSGFTTWPWRRGSPWR